MIQKYEPFGAFVFIKITKYLKGREQVERRKIPIRLCRSWSFYRWVFYFFYSRQGHLIRERDLEH